MTKITLLVFYITILIKRIILYNRYNIRVVTCLNFGRSLDLHSKTESNPDLLVQQGIFTFSQNLVLTLDINTKAKMKLVSQAKMSLYCFQSIFLNQIAKEEKESPNRNE